MKKWVPWLLGGGSIVIGAAASVLLDCADPRENEGVDVVSTCDTSSLSSDPSSPQSSVKTYVAAAQQLATSATNAENLLRDGCNEVDTALGLTTGNDVATACQPIAQRITNIRKTQPQPPPGPAPPDWFNLTAPPSCHTDPTAVATCITTCSAGPCDNTKCAANAISGTCPGTCSGLCVSTDVDGGACVGDCQGTCTDLAPDGGAGTNACLGECTGSCIFPPAIGFCTAGCGLKFYGECDGTCTGLCDGQPINGGTADAGPAPEGGPPTGNDGNCKGVCTGWCSSNRYGSCSQPCGPPTFKGGICGNGAANGPCSNTCISGTGSGCAGRCAGTCTVPTGDAGATCSGRCVGKCDQPMTNTTCSGALDCSQNLECNNACNALGGVSVQCTEPMALEVEAIGDLALYNAMKQHGGKIAEALQMVSILRNAESFIDNRTISDFAALSDGGVTGDLVRACVASGQTAVQQASTALQAATTADPTRRQ